MSTSDLPMLSWTAGFDSMATIGPFTYVTKGNQYIRYSGVDANKMDEGYPKLIQGNFFDFTGDLAAFADGFDSMGLGLNGNFYVSKGNLYAAFTPEVSEAGTTLTLLEGGALPIQGRWGDLPVPFSSGFDSMSLLANGKMYVTKDNEYLRYTNQGPAFDPSYPLNIDQETWGLSDSPFNVKFDSMALLPNAKLYVTCGSEYIRYTDPDAFTVDSGYPLPLAGNWDLPDHRVFHD